MSSKITKIAKERFVLQTFASFVSFGIFARVVRLCGGFSSSAGPDQPAKL
jgi:hypothetical protein